MQYKRLLNISAMGGQQRGFRSALEILGDMPGDLVGIRSVLEVIRPTFRAYPFLLLTVPHVGAQTTAPISGQQLDDLVALVALYPDLLVAQVLAASTYPIEIAEAQQWVNGHPKWKPR